MGVVTQTVYSAWYPSRIPFRQYRYAVRLIGSYWVDLETQRRWRIKWWVTED